MIVQSCSSALTRVLALMVLFMTVVDFNQPTSDYDKVLLLILANATIVLQIIMLFTTWKGAEHVIMDSNS